MTKWRVFSLDEVSVHNSAVDLWMIVHGKVYDVTPFVNSHPGGPEVLFEYAGTDCTESFDEVGHSQDSIDMLKPLCKGVISEQDIVSEEVDEAKHHVSNASVGESKWKKTIRRKPKNKTDTEYILLLGLLALAAAIGYVYLLTNRE